MTGFGTPKIRGSLTLTLQNSRSQCKNSVSKRQLLIWHRFVHEKNHDGETSDEPQRTVIKQAPFETTLIQVCTRLLSV